MKNYFRRISVFSLAAITLLFAVNASAQYTENVLFLFNNTNGSFGNSIVRAANGDLYGTTVFGGKTTCPAGSCGVVFKLSNSSGTWVYSLLHAFTGGADGANPGSIVLDASGNIYGTSYGGVNAGGIAYKLSQANGIWKFSILHSFPQGSSDGSNAFGAIIGPDGALYGATSSGGNSGCSGSGCGTIFKLAKTTSGQWRETILHRFAGGAHDGSFPNGNLVFDASGNIYGPTLGGNTTACSSGCGTVFKLAPNSNGTYTGTLIHTFTGNSGGTYPDSIAVDASGNIFGSTLEGGDTTACTNGGCGTVFELSPGATHWTFSTLYKFTYSGDGYLPEAVALDGSGNLIGIATFGERGVEGSAFELSPNGSGGWNFNTLFLFSDPTGGGAPTALVLDSAGDIFGVTETGGDVSSTSSGDGVVFELSPPAM